MLVVVITVDKRVVSSAASTDILSSIFLCTWSLCAGPAWQDLRAGPYAPALWLSVSLNDEVNRRFRVK